MQLSKSLKIFNLGNLYVSQQHGALITIISVNMMGILHSDKIQAFQFCSLLFGLSAFHAMEILLLPIRQKEKLHSAFFIYSFLATFCGLFLAAHQPQFLLLISGLIILSSLFFLTKNIPKTKTIFHLVSFALIIWISLFSLNTESSRKTINLFIQLLAYFSFTVAFIHWRLGKIPFNYLRILFLSEILLCGILLQWKGIIALAIIIIAKALLILIFKRFWQKAPLKILGYEETISLTTYIILMIFI